MDKIGIFGGSFEPIHLAHLIIADLFVEKYSLSKCLLIPTHQSPFKINHSEKPIFTKELRIKLLELSIKENSKFIIEDYEINRDKISYTIETLIFLKEKYKNTKLYLLIGNDQAESFHKWKDWEAITDLAQIVIANRKTPTQNKKYEFELLKPNLKLEFLQNPIIEISGTEIRNRILNNQSIKYFLHNSAYNFLKSIHFHNLQ
jgi:nicotinate-nucleotide adenylyltransferase